HTTHDSTIVILPFFLTLLPPPSPPLFPYTTLFRSHTSGGAIKLFSLEDSARIDTSGGGIEVNDLGGELDAHTSGGSKCRCGPSRSEEHTSGLQSLTNLVCRLLLAKKKQIFPTTSTS